MALAICDTIRTEFPSEFSIKVSSLAEKEMFGSNWGIVVDSFCNWIIIVGVMLIMIKTVSRAMPK